MLENAGVYTQPEGQPAKDTTFDVTIAHDTDSALSFSDIGLAGNFYNGMRGDLNLVLRFNASQLASVITATLAEHSVAAITSANWQQLGAVTNTPQAAVNNGVIVSLADGSTWTVTGTSYLTALSLDATSAVAARPGRRVTMTVGGEETAITPGASYAGAIVITAV